MIKKIRLKISQKDKVKSFLFCLFFTVVLWLAQTMSDTYVYERIYPIKFTGYNTQKYSLVMCDTLLPVSVKSTGFQYLYGMLERKKTINFDISESNYYISDGNFVYALPMRDNKDEVKEQISFLHQKELGFLIDTAKIVLTPRTIKKVKPVLKDVIFSFAPQYALYGEASLHPDSIEVYGSEASLKDIDCVETKAQTISNINKSGMYVLELDNSKNKHLDVTMATETLNIYLPVEKYTETTVTLPLKFVSADTTVQARLYPENIELVVDVALKDYKNINSTMFEVEVNYDENTDKQTLPVIVSKFPSVVKIRKINPQQVQYVIIK